ncbi:MAG TPA: peptidyl-prolyl cis-trans isomerase [Myxococcales bacterium]|nr:peptidyl-prolyl cis-trans isomerase [Myxococcales bacterium]
MNLRFGSVLCLALALAACSKKADKSGPVVAEVGSETITADELKQRLNETSPFLRARYTTLERKKEFLENMIRNELLAQEAVRQGYDKSPAVREQMKRAMIQELIRHQLDSRLSGTDISDEDLKKFYDAHLDDFVKPERARVFHILLPARDAKERAAQHKKAAALIKDIDAREKKGEVNAFQTTAIKESKDPLSAPMGGDLRFLSKEELAKAYNPELANGAFELKNPGDKSAPFDTPAGVELVKLQVKTVAMNRTFDESKDSIRQRMARERRSRDYDEWVRKLREGTKVSINEQELDKVQVEAAPAAPAIAQPPISAGHPQAQPPVAPVQPSPGPAQKGPPPTAASKIGGN